MDKVLDELTNFACGLSYEDLPEGVTRAAKERIFDSLGCAVGAMDCVPAKIELSLAGAPGPAGLRGTVLGSTEIVAAEKATFVNTCMIRYLDFNDSFPRGHPSDSLGALFAFGPSAKATGRDFIAATVVAYEVFCRFSITARLELKGIDQGFYIAVCTAAGLANMLNLDADATRNSISISATTGLPLRTTRCGELSMWKGTATALAAQTGALAVELARNGMTGPEAPISGRHGFFDAIGKELQLRPFGKASDDFFIPQVYTKYWPVAYQIQAVVWAGIELREQVNPEDLVSIVIETNSYAVTECGSEPEKWSPKTSGTADHSMPYVLAYALRHGVIDHKAFEPNAYLDPTMRPVMNRITVEATDEMEDGYPMIVKLRVRAEGRNGKTYVVDCVNPLGHPENPISQAELGKKFKRLCVPVIGEAATDAMISFWENLDEADSLTDGFDPLLN